MANVDNLNQSQTFSAHKQDFSVLLYRIFSWGTVGVLFAFLLNNYLSNWRGWPGAGEFLSGESKETLLSVIQFVIYTAGAALAVFYVWRTKAVGLRPDSKKIYALTAYIIRGAFWAVLLLGLVDMAISFLRVEGLLPSLVGAEMTTELGRQNFRGMYIHIPVVIIGFIAALFIRGLGFPWLALLVVIAELLIVISVFVFSYEQAFMGDLVRFWYAALFLFASAHTLLEEGHVRVDLFYAGLEQSTKGFINAFGSIFLGMSLCWVILAYGMGSPRTIITSPLMVFEKTQQDSGMFVKYWMAAFLAVFAISMLIQFAGYFLEGMADYRGDPDDENKKEEAAAAH